MSHRQSLVGRTFTRLEAVADAPSTKRGQARSWCHCQCGNPELRLVTNNNLVRGEVQSCGCLRRDANISRAFSLADFVLRFWESHRVVQRAYPTPCWEWTRSKNTEGYGQVNWRGKRWSAPVLAWKFEHGSVPDGMEVCHHCDWPPCINPAHLFLGTHCDNMHDSIAKGRFVYPPNVRRAWNER